MSSKFNKELQTLVKDKIISPELSEKIEQYYSKKEIDKPNKLFTIFGVFGSLLIGSGIILMLAYNWEGFTRFTKTVLAFVPLLLGQVLAGYSILKQKSRAWRETSGTFLFFSVGVSISLVSQVYNIMGDLGDFLQIWIILCLPLIYLIRSHALAILLLIFSTAYALEVGVWNYRSTETPWLYIVFLLAIIPHYLWLLKKNISNNIIAVFNWVLPLSISCALSAFIRGGEYFGLAYITLFALLYIIGKQEVFKELRTLKKGFLIIGSLGAVISLMIFTFRWVWEEFSRDIVTNSEGFYTASVLLIMALSGLIYTIKKRGIHSINLFQVTFLIFWIIFFVPINITIPLILTNILVFALGISAIKIGTDKFNFGILNYGMLIISILIVCRFFDTGMSFVIKGILFITVGIGFFLTNYIMLKRQQKLKQLKNSKR
ncbi:DUF2157 domain-containing protein [Aquimarina sp. 2201CG5-10]|uniref:DUF2157 domain-containing protein n=1 Tax=Aquimarina callyspongiae TaxID=3098150 RepID=UPI002AB5C967|nr:DUF2157 domain-containing protein [Aquimarina sp. 2201CG5-10]MDY8136424.1 DUF2157 domain-containing protein [Aquimarina sp. 2201CG5-10]